MGVVWLAQLPLIVDDEDFRVSLFPAPGMVDGQTAIQRAWWSGCGTTGPIGGGQRIPEGASMNEDRSANR
jgi:hypothetical protein